MKPECMPGMLMPGCASAVPRSQSQAGTPIIELILVLVVILSAYVLFFFIWRYLQRGQLGSYHALPDLLDHVLHALGMIGMALLMIGTLRYIGPLLAYVAAFSFFALVFLVRLGASWSSCSRRAESWHVFINASMAYMFAAADVAWITAACLVVYLGFIGIALRSGGPHLEAGLGSGPEGRALRTLGANGDLTIAVSMMLMLAVSQWPQLFT
jgi:hypothetical protein